MGDFLYVEHRQTVHRDMLAALIRDPEDWRAGEVARILSIDNESARRTRFTLEFHDGHRHDAEISFENLGTRPPSDLGIYYRFLEPLNGNLAEENLVRQGHGLKGLIMDYIRMSRDNPHLHYLEMQLLETQYRLLFSEPFPSK